MQSLLTIDHEPIAERGRNGGTGSVLRTGSRTVWVLTIDNEHGTQRLLGTSLRVAAQMRFAPQRALCLVSSHGHAFDLAKFAHFRNYLFQMMIEFNNALFRFRDMLFGFRDALFGFRGALSGFRDALSGFRDALSGFCGALSGFRDALYGFRDALYGFRDMLFAFNGALKGIRDALADFSGGLTRHWGQLTGYGSALIGLQGAITGIYGTKRGSTNTANRDVANE